MNIPKSTAQSLPHDVTVHLAEVKSSVSAKPSGTDAANRQGHAMTHSTLNQQPAHRVVVAPATPEPWQNTSNLWPGRSDMQEVAQNVWITNFFGARKLSLLRSQNVTHVLVCADELPIAFPHSFQYLKLDGFTDNTGTDLWKQLDNALPWMDEALRGGGRVLLHCAAGSSRSGSVVIAYLMRFQHMTLQQALSTARRARPIIDPNAGFLEQLEQGPPQADVGQILATL